MNRKDAIQSLIQVMAFELLQFIAETESSFEQKWVPATHIKDRLGLNFAAVPSKGVQRGEKGWLFAILTRILEDQGLLEHKTIGRKALYRRLPL